MKSSTLREDPNRDMPYTDKVEPTRRNPRRDKLDPMFKKSRIDKLDPKRVMPYIETELP
jgi:hypothetical protein